MLTSWRCRGRARGRLNLLLIQLKRIGDLILTVPAIATLRKAFPDGKYLARRRPRLARIAARHSRP